MLTQWGYDAVAVENGEQALAELSKPHAPRLVLLDWILPGADGMEVCRRIRAAEPDRFTYIILLTAKDGAHNIVTALDGGANDYLAKPFESEELRARLGVGMRMLHLHEELERANKRLTETVATDYLTQLLNRRALMQRLEEELSRTRRENLPIVGVMIDIDHFKNINDTYGHQVGDDVLVEVAARLRHACRIYDIVGRYGGEEFLIVITHTDKDVTARLAERLRAAISDAPFRADGHVISVTISVGVVWAAPGVHCDADSLIKSADQLLYAAKRGGRNQVVMEEFGDAE
jgi:two-component system chemotaxis response regulator CheY